MEIIDTAMLDALSAEAGKIQGCGSTAIFTLLSTRPRSDYLVPARLQKLSQIFSDESADSRNQNFHSGKVKKRSSPRKQPFVHL